MIQLLKRLRRNYLLTAWLNDNLDKPKTFKKALEGLKIIRRYELSKIHKVSAISINVGLECICLYDSDKRINSVALKLCNLLPEKIKPPADVYAENLLQLIMGDDWESEFALESLLDSTISNLTIIETNVKPNNHEYINRQLNKTYFTIYKLIEVVSKLEQ